MTTIKTYRIEGDCESFFITLASGILEYRTACNMAIDFFAVYDVVRVVDSLSNNILLVVNNYLKEV